MLIYTSAVWLICLTLFRCFGNLLLSGRVPVCVKLGCRVPRGSFAAEYIDKAVGYFEVFCNGSHVSLF